MDANNSNLPTNQNILIYILKIWILTNVFSATIIQLLAFIQNDASFWTGALFILVLGLLLSLPGMLILTFVIKKYTHKKLFLIFLSLILVFASFYIFGFSNPKYIRTFLYPAIYSVVITCLIIVFKRNFHDESRIKI